MKHYFGSPLQGKCTTSYAEKIIGPNPHAANCSIFICTNQNAPIEELIHKQEPGWSLVQEWIKEATNKVEVLPADTVRSKEALYQTQETTRSPMGAIIYSSGGLLIDGGWIRILGSGHPRLARTVPDWNKGKSFKNFGEQPSFLLVGDDAIGGFFAVNGGGLGDDPGKVYYFSRISWIGNLWALRIPNSCNSVSTETWKGSMKTTGGKVGSRK